MTWKGTPGPLGPVAQTTAAAATARVASPAATASATGSALPPLATADKHHDHMFVHPHMHSLRDNIASCVASYTTICKFVAVKCMVDDKCT